MRICDKVTALAPGKESSEQVLKFNLDLIDDTQAIIVVRMRNDRTVETSWSKCHVSDLAFMAKCLDSDVLDMIKDDAYTEE